MEKKKESEIPDWFNLENYDLETLLRFEKEDWVKQFIVRFFICETPVGIDKHPVQERCEEDIKTKGVVNIEEYFEIFSDAEASRSPDKLNMVALKKFFPRVYELFRYYKSFLKYKDHPRLAVRGVSLHETQIIKTKLEALNDACFPDPQEFFNDFLKKQKFDELDEEEWRKRLPAAMEAAEKEYSDEIERLEDKRHHDLSQPLITSSGRLLVSLDLTASAKVVKEKIAEIFSESKLAVTKPNDTTLAERKVLPAFDLSFFEPGMSKSKIICKIFEVENDLAERDAFNKVTQKWINRIRDFDYLKWFILEDF